MGLGMYTTTIGNGWVCISCALVMVVRLIVTQPRSKFNECRKSYCHKVIKAIQQKAECDGRFVREMLLPLKVLSIVTPHHLLFG